MEHRFSYPYYFFAFDLADAGKLNELGSWVGFDRPAVFGVRSRAYLGCTPEPLATKFQHAIEQTDCRLRPARTVLVTCPNLLGYTFNPVCFYMLYDDNGNLNGFVPEVHNTFGGWRLYPQTLDHGSATTAAFVFPKELYVSPFMAMNYHYHFSITFDADKFSVTIDMVRNGETDLSAGFSGQGKPLTRAAAASLALRRPLLPWLTMPRIHWQAFRLYYQRRLGTQQFDEEARRSGRRLDGARWAERCRAWCMRRLFRRPQTDAQLGTTADSPRPGRARNDSENTQT